MAVHLTGTTVPPEVQSALYDQYYAAASDILKRENPCKPAFVDGGFVCEAMRLNGPTFGVGCCNRCEHLGPTGCTVESLGCRVSGCYQTTATSIRMAGWSPEVVADLNALKQAALMSGIPVYFRASKPQSFTDQSSGKRNDSWHYGL